MRRLIGDRNKTKGNVSQRSFSGGPHASEQRPEVRESPKLGCLFWWSCDLYRELWIKVAVCRSLTL